MWNSVRNRLLAGGLGGRIARTGRWVQRHKFVLVSSAAAIGCIYAFGTVEDFPTEYRTADGAVYGIRYLPGPIAECAKERPLTLQELTNSLELQLPPVRQKLAEKGYPAPTVNVTPAQDSSNTHVLMIVLPRDINLVKLLIESMNFVGTSVSLIPYPENAIAVVNTANSSSLLIEPRGNEVQISLFQDNGFTKSNVNNFVQLYYNLCSSRWSNQRSSSRMGLPSKDQQHQFETESPAASSGTEAIINELRALGVLVYQKPATDALTWDSLAGYEDIKREIDDSILMSLKHTETYDKIATGTRERFESNRPRAVLFEGPPGTGKTLSARIIANQCDIPLIHVPLESIVTKWFGESERNLSKVFEKAEELGGAILFIDEIDALGTSRDGGDMHEASRRVLSVLLQKLDGFQGRGKSMLICATNRKSDLDAALINRFGMTLHFGLPDLATRQKVLHRYAKQLKQDDLARIAGESRGMSCRDLKEACEHAERRWAAKLIRGERIAALPDADQYMQCLRDRMATVDHSKATVRM